MKRLFYLLLGILSGILLLIPIGRLRQFILEPDYVPGFVKRNQDIAADEFVVRCDGGRNG